MTADPIGTRLAELARRVADGDIRFATAESCTGGQLAAALAMLCEAVPNAVTAD
jgi:nicotinamide-nucleotide amidase